MRNSSSLLKSQPADVTRAGLGGGLLLGARPAREELVVCLLEGVVVVTFEAWLAGTVVEGRGEAREGVFRFAFRTGRAV